MKRLILTLLAFSAINCSSGHQYERGAYTPPVRAPTFSPVEDAPHTTGQPGYVNGQRVERSTNKRYVDPSREPQMMAADGDDKRAVELMFSEPVPDETPPGIKDEEYAKCWKDFLKMMERERKSILKFSPEEVRCMRYKVLSHCGARQVERRTSAVGKLYDSTFEDKSAENQRKACGRRHEYDTQRVVDMGNALMNHGDNVLGWRHPPFRGYRN